MKRQIPPLNCLRPFEATVRTGSTTRAADELGVTHSAVSRQIKALEQWLGRKLFSRDGGRLTLTSEGKDYFETVFHILNLLDQTTDSLIGEGKEQVVRVHGPTAFINRWLIPRLDRFHRLHPTLDVWFSDFSPGTELTSNLGDVGIAMEPGLWRDVDAVVLMPDLVFPVCHSGLATRFPDDAAVLNHKLLCSNDPFLDWDGWFAGVGLPTDRAGRRSQVGDLDQTLRYAANGHGIALARGQLVAEDLAARRLVRPLRQALKLDQAYWLIKPKYGRISAAVRAFTRWIREEAARSSRPPFEDQRAESDAIAPPSRFDAARPLRAVNAPQTWGC